MSWPFFLYKIIGLVLTNRAVMHKKFSAFLGKKKVFWERAQKNVFIDWLEVLKRFAVAKISKISWPS